MKFLNALSLTFDVNAWLTNSNHPRILHVFDHACNLINENREVLSVVTKHIGNGPFNLVVEEDVSFVEHLNVDSPVTVQDNYLLLGNLTIHTADAQQWSPQPNWENLHTRQDKIFDQIAKLPGTTYQPFLPHSLLSTFSTSIAAADVSSCITSARQLAGLGQGLTPSGDDFILGALYAAWIMHPPEMARVLAQEVTHTAAPLTTSLSAAWLKAAGKGEAGVLWHEFFDALISGEAMTIQSAMDTILAVGATSGADALSGFISTFECNQISTQHEQRSNDSRSDP